MLEDVRAMWADPLIRVIVVALVLATIPAWFIWPGRPAVEAIDAAVLALFGPAMWFRGFLEDESPLAVVGIAVFSLGLVLEAIVWLASGNPPLGVELIFPAGLLIFIVALVARRRRSATA
jgi:hypothetical protein